MVRKVINLGSRVERAVVSESSSWRSDRFDLPAAGRRAWSTLFTSVITEDDLLKWEKTIPHYGCDCQSFYRDWKRENPPEFPVLFSWKHRLHNAVNRKLGKAELPFEVAAHIWRVNSPVRKTRSVPVVSSVSPKKIDRQLVCVQSWLDSGFHVILMQNAKEIDRCRELFPLPVEWKSCETQRPLIREMLQYGAVVNSDCEMRGEGPEFGDSPIGLLRWNFESDKPAREEEWGIDCWYLPPRYRDIIPDDFPYMIGKPFWDYAVHAFLVSHGIKFEIDHTPWLLHESHPLNWNQSDWMEGYRYISKKLPGREYGNAEFRRSIDTMPYNENLGMFHADDS